MPCKSASWVVSDMYTLPRLLRFSKLKYKHNSFVLMLAISLYQKPHEICDENIFHSAYHFICTSPRNLYTCYWTAEKQNIFCLEEQTRFRKSNFRQLRYDLNQNPKVKFSISHPQVTNKKVLIRKHLGKGRNRLELQCFVEESKLARSATGRAVKLFELNILLVSKLPCWWKGTQQIAGAGSTQRSLPGRTKTSWFLLSLGFIAVPCITLVCFLLSGSQPRLWHNLPQLWGTSWVTAYLVVTAKFIQPCPCVTITEIRFRADNGPVATRLLLEQAGNSSSPGKPSYVLSTALAAQGDVCHHFLVVAESHLLTDHLQSLKKGEQVTIFAYKFGLEFSLNSELFGHRVLCCVSQDTSTITNIDAACIYVHSFDRSFIL